VPSGIAEDLALLLTPLRRLGVVEGAVDPAVELVEIHRVDSALKPLVVGLQTRDGLVVEALLVCVALVERILDEGKHIVLECDGREQVE